MQQSRHEVVEYGAFGIPLRHHVSVERVEVEGETSVVFFTDALIADHVGGVVEEAGISMDVSDTAGLMTRS